MNRIFSAFLYFVLFFVLFFPATMASEVKENLRQDDAEVVYRHPSTEKMDKYKNMKIYDYDEHVETDGLWSFFLRWVKQYFKGFGLNPVFVYYFLIVLVVLAIAFYLLKLYGVNPIDLIFFKENKNVEDLNFIPGSEDIYADDLENMLQVCIRNKSYREAIRILYLLALKKMDQTRLIDWKPYKTNRNYYYELSDKALAKQFKSLVRSYEYIWYGQFVVQDEEFTIVNDEFKGFNESCSANVIPNKRI